MRDAELGGTSGSLTELLEAQFKSGLASEWRGRASRGWTPANTSLYPRPALLRDFDDLMRLSQPSSIIGTQTLAREFQVNRP